MIRQGEQVEPDVFRQLLVATDMDPTDWLRAVGLATGEVLASIAEDIELGHVEPNVTGWDEIDAELAQGYLVDCPTGAKVWGTAESAESALPFLNAVKASVGAVLGSQPGTTDTEDPDLSTDVIVIRADLRLHRRGRVLTVSKGLLDECPADAGEVYVEEGEWIIQLDSPDESDLADIRQALGIQEADD